MNGGVSCFGAGMFGVVLEGGQQIGLSLELRMGIRKDLWEVSYITCT